ncbi:hypothetical protein G7015_09540 [Pseudomonas kunmingensis]|uniref:hypothetical protein n=1 Tax=Stutzerimonas kunmingensis TaxID=1211807 RepID=UPI0015E39382|nr:hypothetical protein [Stutzerimonas kunmingensis]MBA1238718.1 hypothetical protein [Stutzerimonas kunmingensis]
MNMHERQVKDRTRTAIQAPIGRPKCVIYLKDRKEHRTAWFSSQERAQQALEIMQAKYGTKNAIIYLD